MLECENPGCCECIGMKRCSSCGYTKHDKDYWQDHHLCDEKRKKSRVIEGGNNAINNLAKRIGANRALDSADDSAREIAEEYNVRPKGARRGIR